MVAISRHNATTAPRNPRSIDIKPLVPTTGNTPNAIVEPRRLAHTPLAQLMSSRVAGYEVLLSGVAKGTACFPEHDVWSWIDHATEIPKSTLTQSRHFQFKNQLGCLL